MLSITINIYSTDQYAMMLSLKCLISFILMHCVMITCYKHINKIVYIDIIKYYFRYLFGEFKNTHKFLQPLWRKMAFIVQD